nr:ankyrin repeat domain-containing protein [Endozoicomonas sp.]
MAEQGNRREENKNRCFKRKISSGIENNVSRIKNKYARATYRSNESKADNVDLEWRNAWRLLENKSINLEKLNSPQKHTNNNIPMIWAAEKGDLNILQALITVGGNIYIQDDLGNTPFSYANFGKHITVVEL